MGSVPTSQWSLPQVTAQARKVFLLALPFAVLFWAFGIGLGGASEDGRNWLNLPMMIAGVALAVWIVASLVTFIKPNSQKRDFDPNA